VQVDWNCDPNWFTRNHRIEVFATQTGFASLATLTPLDQIDCGQCIATSQRNDEQTFDLPEGRTFFTVRLISAHPSGIIGRSVGRFRMKWTDSPVVVRGFVRFAVSVPSSKLAVERIETQTKLVEAARMNAAKREELADEIGELEPNYPVMKHYQQIKRETDQRIATMLGIIESCAEKSRLVLSHPHWSQKEKAVQLRMIEKMKTQQLRQYQCPAEDDDARDEQEG